jgi:hypothetical protein
MMVMLLIATHVVLLLLMMALLNEGNSVIHKLLKRRLSVSRLNQVTGQLGIVKLSVLILFLKGLKAYLDLIGSPL